MSTAEKNIIQTYTEFIEGLSKQCKMELIDLLSNSLLTSEGGEKDRFKNAFGGFSDSESAEFIINDLKQNRKFIEKMIDF